jgi:hypothetical protein
MPVIDTPEVVAHLASLAAWRSKTDAEKRAAISEQATSAVDPELRDRVNACQYRGAEGGLILTEAERTCCCGGAERTECRAGKGKIPGRVTLRECLECMA